MMIGCKLTDSGIRLKNWRQEMLDVRVKLAKKPRKHFVCLDTQLIWYSKFYPKTVIQKKLSTNK